MSIHDDIKRSAAKRLNEIDEAKLREEYKKLLDKAKAKVNSPTTGGARTESDDLRMIAAQALKKLDGQEERFGRLGAEGITALVTELATGDEQAALSIYLATQAGWDEILSMTTAAAVADADAQRRRDKLKDDILSWIKEIGGAAAKAALPFLLMSLTGSRSEIK